VHEDSDPYNVFIIEQIEYVTAMHVLGEPRFELPPKNRMYVIGFVTDAL